MKRTMVHLILASSYTNDISTLAFDPQNSKLNVVSTITVGHHPSWITFYPGDHSLVFTGLEQADGKLVALKYDEDGKGTMVAKAPSGGADPCSLLATKDELFVANVCQALEKVSQWFRKCLSFSTLLGSLQNSLSLKIHHTFLPPHPARYSLRAQVQMPLGKKDPILTRLSYTKRTTSC